MTRLGCPRCGDVIRESDHFLACACGDIYADGTGLLLAGDEPPVELPTAVDVLVFKLGFAGRGDEAAVVQELRP